MASTDPPETQHRIKVRILVVFASILAFLAIFTSWIDRQALNTNRWVDTSGKLREDKTISDAVASYTVDQLYANVDVSAVIKQRLPMEVQQFSAPLAAGVRQFATQAAEQRGRLEPERQGRPQPPAAGPPAGRPHRAEETAQSEAPPGRRTARGRRLEGSRHRPDGHQAHRGAVLVLHLRERGLLRPRG